MIHQLRQIYIKINVTDNSVLNIEEEIIFLNMPTQKIGIVCDYWESNYVSLLCCHMVRYKPVLEQEPSVYTDVVWYMSYSLAERQWV